MTTTKIASAFPQGSSSRRSVPWPRTRLQRQRLRGSGVGGTGEARRPCVVAREMLADTVVRSQPLNGRLRIGHWADERCNPRHRSIIGFERNERRVVAIVARASSITTRCLCQPGWSPRRGETVAVRPGWLGSSDLRYAKCSLSTTGRPGQRTTLRCGQQHRCRRRFCGSRCARSDSESDHLGSRRSSTLSTATRYRHHLIIPRIVSY